MSNLNILENTKARHFAEIGRRSAAADATRLSGTVEFQSGLSLAVDGAGTPIPPPVRFYTQGRTKRLFDIAVAATALAVLAGPLLVVAALVRLTSPGPALFRQERHGRDGAVIRVLKFRTLRASESDFAGTVQTESGDTRVTLVGRILRRTSIDELPQLLNVLKGDMSIVGPRPHPIGMKAAGLRYEDLLPYYHLRHSVRPGLTGWAQANGFRGPTGSTETATARIKHDLAYIGHASLTLDLKIILLTFRSEFLTGTGT